MQSGATGIGPGVYNPTVDNWGGGYTIGRDKRQGIYDNKEGPGVGTYGFKGDFDTQRGGYSFKRSDRKGQLSTTPGFYKPMYSVPDVPKYLLPPEPQRKIHM